MSTNAAAPSALLSRQTRQASLTQRTASGRTARRVPQLFDRVGAVGPAADDPETWLASVPPQPAFSALECVN